MRKLERQMIQAIIERRNWKGSNTEVIVDDKCASVYLHDHRIGEYTFSDMSLMIADAGWQTFTTKSRLNALTKFVTGCSCVFQKNFEWFLSTSKGTVPFEDGWNAVV